MRHILLVKKNKRNYAFVRFRPDFMSNLVGGLAFGISKFYIAPYGKINRGLVNLSNNSDVKFGP